MHPIEQLRQNSSCNVPIAEASPKKPVDFLQEVLVLETALRLISQDKDRKGVIDRKGTETVSITTHGLEAVHPAYY
ncbi:4641_t:CDS:2 [Funneliformis caledonium]|uniref:4641_t:CDS:1 n=1 Tax=Funneliformis caledonium TaxID=1117310 RepID=A0A9N9F8U3_9GLOM|nr:4641_t:CDS:2 [Funneliformis caledonium]